MRKDTHHSNDGIMPTLSGRTTSLNIGFTPNTMQCFSTPRKEKYMGSFTKSHRKRQVKRALQMSQQLNRYLIQRVTQLTQKEPTIEQVNQARMDLIRSVTGG